MFWRIIAIAFGTVLLAGCAGPAAQPLLTANHPASPEALEAPPPTSSQTLAVGESTEMGKQPQGSMPGMQHMGNDMGGMKGMEHEMPGMKQPMPSSQPATTQAATLYTCRMHPEVVSDKPGKCPKCGMKLVVKTDAAAPTQGGHE